MAPVKKQQVNKSPNRNGKQGKNEPNLGSVVSGQLQTKINKKPQKPPKDPKGVVFIKHLPHGFFEDQLKKYFEQFGSVTRVRLARSCRTGKSKGYAFVEFQYPEVAEVAAETMDNYLMFKQIVKASYIPPEKQEFNFFRSSVKQVRNKSGKLVWISAKTASIHKRTKKQNEWSEKNYQKRTQKQLEKIKKIGDKYSHLGININEIIIQPNIIKAKEKKPKKEISLEDLLGDTIPEDSEDEDYDVSNLEDDYKESEESSNEETYDSVIDSDNLEDENLSDDERVPILPKKSNKKFIKDPNVKGVDHILKRRRDGGIIKTKKKLIKKPAVGTKKASLQKTAAKELAKPLSKLKTTIKRPLKVKKLS